MKWPGRTIDGSAHLTIDKAIIEMLDSVKDDINRGELFHGHGSWANHYYTHMLAAKALGADAMFGVLLGGDHLFYFNWYIGATNLEVFKQL